MKKQYDLVIIGGGPAGLAAGLAAAEHYRACNETEDGKILLVERATELGGILNQCIHPGFGLHIFKEELTGPEYAKRYEQKIYETGVEIAWGAMVTSITRERQISIMSQTQGYCTVTAKAVVLAMGCRERPRGALNIPGTRPAGVISAGTAQLYVNRFGYLPGKQVVILGSGDIGLIMARRMVLEGAKVEAVVEIQSKAGGLVRNVVQCLEDFDIPLLLSSTVTKVLGSRRVSGVLVSQVDAKGEVVPGTEREIACDTLLVSCGLIPENELTRQLGARMDDRTGGPVVDENCALSVEGYYACGNVVHVHELVDHVSRQAEIAGAAAAAYALSQGK